MLSPGSRAPMPRTPSWAGKLPKVEVYVDETGDRGFGKNSSSFFAMTALMIPAESVSYARAVAAGLRYEIGTSRPLHWVEHFKPKRADRRRLATRMLASIPNVKTIHVITHKATVQFNEALRSDNEKFYNYTTRLLLERIALAAHGWHGGARLAILRLGSVRHMDHDGTVSYLNLVQNIPSPVHTPWEHIRWPPSWHGTSEYDGLQLADLHAGILSVALRGAPDDVRSAQLLIECGHQLHRANGKLLNCGVKIIGENDFVTNRSWWPSLLASI
ncbi:Protein of unknown function [Actinopolyspora lacussalsi subsp. righensis]|uniref:DUF3800 domain-containing protein n=1 Tax=Actinopolyspora righensis TaxID=995060 RepID=A0A1I7B930_9ACTN|nr:Protein of unknown function [Actinopolyspora righensis]